MKLSLISILVLATVGCFADPCLTDGIPCDQSSDASQEVANDAGLTKNGKIDHPAPADADQPEGSPCQTDSYFCTGDPSYNQIDLPCTPPLPNYWCCCGAPRFAQVVCTANGVCP